MLMTMTRSQYVASHGGNEDYVNGKVVACDNESCACMSALVLDELGVQWLAESADEQAEDRAAELRYEQYLEELGREEDYFPRDELNPNAW
jgi:hypothetical protein